VNKIYQKEREGSNEKKSTFDFGDLSSSSKKLTNLYPCLEPFLETISQLIGPPTHELTPVWESGSDFEHTYRSKDPRGSFRLCPPFSIEALVRRVYEVVCSPGAVFYVL